jgi:hypothetical protein
MIGSRVAPIQPNRTIRKQLDLNSVPRLMARAWLDAHIISPGSREAPPFASVPRTPIGYVYSAGVDDRAEKYLNSE